MRKKNTGSILYSKRRHHSQLVHAGTSLDTRWRLDTHMLTQPVPIVILYTPGPRWNACLVNRRKRWPTCLHRMTGWKLTWLEFGLKNLDMRTTRTERRRKTMLVCNCHCNLCLGTSPNVVWEYPLPVKSVTERVNVYLCVFSLSERMIWRLLSNYNAVGWFKTKWQKNITNCLHMFM